MVSRDYDAIRNSIYNLFNTNKGERILIPDYGCDLKSAIFEPITDTTSRTIGKRIKSSIEQWEPRVRVLNMQVDAYIDANEYHVSMQLAIPNIQNTFTPLFKGLTRGFLI